MTNAALKTVALVAILGVPALLTLAWVYGVLSPRAWADGLITWFVVVFLLTVLVKQMVKKIPPSRQEPAAEFDDNARRRVLRRIWAKKAWIGILAILLPIGIANGIAQRAWLPTLVGVGMSLLWMYVEAKDIRRLRKRLSSTGSSGTSAK